VYPTVVDTGAEIRCLRRPGPASQHADVPARDGEPAGRPPGGCTHVDTKTANWHPSRPVRPGSAGAPSQSGPSTRDLDLRRVALTGQATKIPRTAGPTGVPC